jgi:hypothetical protein
MKWRRGKPNAPGLWLLIAGTGDIEAWRVEWDKGDAPRRYLRMSDGMDSWPVKEDPWPPRKSFGPIEEPGGRAAAG